jgi:hypothetical protein
MNTCKQVAKAWSNWTGKMHTFTKMLDEKGVEYLSFTKISAVEFCPQRYLLEYVEGVKLRPEPNYYVKGRLFHEAAARLHRARMRGRRVSLDQLVKPVERRMDEDDANHIRNAIDLMQREIEADWDVVAVEEPFVLDLGPDLPPCLGIVDLVLRKGDQFAVIDHKSGKQFYGTDRLQLVLYHEHVRRQYGAERCVGYYDQYRWVNNLDRIRKPASCRTKATIRKGTWNTVLRRITKRYRQMQKIEKTGSAGGGASECWGCPYGNLCPLATFEYSNNGWY